MPKMTEISNRPETDHTTNLEELFIAKLGGRREYGRFRDALVAQTRRPRRRRRAK